MFVVELVGVVMIAQKKNSHDYWDPTVLTNTSVHNIQG